MEDGDDEFGDLYADVEVEASSAMNGAPQFPQLQFVSAETDKQNSVFEASSDKEDKVIDDIEFDEDDDDDDDDDLDIVLNSDDDSTRYGEGVTFGRTNTKLRSGELEDEDDDNIGMEEFVVGKAGSGGDGINQNLVGGGKGPYNSHSMYKYLRSQSASYASDLKGSGCGEDNGYCQRMGSRSMGPQSGQRFSLPRARNILDVNIDIFEQKPWKQPGADITDYFNFGFNEDTWKLYCNEVDEFRHRSSGTPASEPAQLMEIKAYGGGVEHEIVACETKQRKGQPIQVEDSNVERQSSMDVRRQLDRDSDVIQITILDSEEHCSGSAKERLSHHDGSVPESSNHRDVSVDDGKDHLSFSSASEDESVKERGGEDTCTTDPSMLVVEKSPANHSEESKRPDDKRQHGENRYHGDSKCKLHDDSYSRKLADKRKPGDHRYHARCNSPVNNSRVHRGSKPKLHPENDFCSRRPDDKRKPGEHRYRHHSPVYNHRSYGVSKLKPHHENDDSFPMSDIVGPYDMPSTDGRNRRNERLRSIDPYDEGNISYSRELELPSCYYGERFFGYGDRDTLARDFHHEGYERFEANMDLCALRSSEEEEYYGERRRYIEDDKMMARDWCHHERELAVEHVNFFSNQNSNYSSYLKHKRGALWKRNGDNLQFRTKNEDDECFLERECLDDIQGERFRSLACDDRERDDFERNYVKHVGYTRWEFRGSERNKRRAGSPSSGLNHPLLTRDEDRDLRYKKGHFFTSRSSEESHINNDRWHDNMTPRNNPYGRHGRYRAQWTGSFRNDGSLVDSEPFDRENYTIDIGDRVDMGRTRRHWRSEMQWKEDEAMVRNDDAKFCGERASFRFEKVSRRKSFVSEHELDRVEESIGHPHVEGCKYKTRGVINDKFDRISNVTFEGSPEQRFQGSGDSLYSHLVDGSNNVEVLINDLNAEGRKYEQKREVISGNKCSKTHGKSREQLALSCRNSVDSHLVVGEGKSADKAERNVDERKKKASMDFNPCPSDTVAVKAVKTKGMAKGLDTEQGQIQTEEVNIMKNDGVNDENGKMGFDKSRILEAMAKMEKRRARFKDQITTNKNDADSTTKPTVVDSVQQRPARKRRWGGN